MRDLIRAILSAGALAFTAPATEFFKGKLFCHSGVLAGLKSGGQSLIGYGLIFNGLILKMVYFF